MKHKIQLPWSGKGGMNRLAERLHKQSMKKGAASKLAGLSDAEAADRLRGVRDSFLCSTAWRELRDSFIEKHGAKCLCCGVVPKRKSSINVDHVKPRKFYPELALDESNLQVLCGKCNKAKGNKDTDYRVRA